MSLPGAGPCLRIRSGTVTAPTTVVSRVSKSLHCSSSSMLTPNPQMICHTTLRIARKRVQAYAFGSTALVRIMATSEIQGRQARVKTMATNAGMPLTPSESPAQSTSSLTWKSSFTTSTPSEPQIPSVPIIEVEPIPAADDLSDQTYTERANLLLSKRSLIEEAARVDHERAVASKSAPSSSSASTFKVPMEEISLMLQMKTSKGQEEESSEKVKGSLAHSAGKAIRDKKLCGVAVSVGKMDRTVTVRFPRRDWSRKVKKVSITGYQHTFNFI